MKKKLIIILLITISGFTQICNADNQAQSTKQEKVKALELYTKACDGGDGDGCYNLGIIYDSGDGVKQNKTKAAELFIKAAKLDIKACDSGDYVVCNNLGARIEAGKDYQNALKFYAKACDGGEALGCTNLGQMYDYGEGVRENKLKAVELYTKACDGGEASGCNKIGVMYEVGDGITKNLDKAKILFQKACDGGYDLGCTNLGDIYHQEQDYQNSFKLYTKACKGEESIGCENLGRMYGFGNGITKNLDKGRIFLQKSCDLNNLDGCAYLGVTYWGTKNTEKAKLYLEKSCNLKSSSASGQGCFLLGSSYKRNDLGVKQNYLKVIQYYKKSCDELSFGHACFSLGLLYKYGERGNVKINYNEAMKYFNIGCQIGDEDSCNGENYKVVY